MIATAVPEPFTRVPVAMYTELLTWMLARGTEAQGVVHRAKSTVSLPETLEKMAIEIIWNVLCDGRSAQAAWTIE